MPPPSYESVAGAQANVTTSNSNEMKSSKSVGDIMAEIKKEAEAFEKMKIKGHRRKNSRTPPPISVGNPSKNVMDDWIPWPDLDGSSGGAKSSPTTTPSVNPALLDLGMNFYITQSRVFHDSKKMCNFCEVSLISSKAKIYVDLKFFRLSSSEGAC